MRVVAEPWTPTSYTPAQNPAGPFNEPTGGAYGVDSTGLSSASAPGGIAEPWRAGPYTPVAQPGTAGVAAGYPGYGGGTQRRTKGWDASPRKFSPGLLAAWIALTVIVAGMTLLNNLPQKSVDISTVDPSDIPSPILRFMGRYTVGAKQVIQGLPQGQVGNPVNDLIRQLDMYANNPADQLRVVTLVGELAGGEKAIARLDAIGVSYRLPPKLKEDAALLRTIYREGAGQLNEDQVASLKKRHRWFAEIALSYGLSETDPARIAALAPAKTVLAMVWSVACTGMLAGLAGLVLAIIAVVKICTGKLRSGYMTTGHRAVGAPSAWVETIVIFLVGLVATRLIALAVIGAGGPDLSNYLVWLLMLTPLWPLVRGVPRQDLKMALGLHKGRGVMREIGAGFVGYIAGLPILAIGVIMVLVMNFFKMQVMGVAVGATEPGQMAWRELLCTTLPTPHLADAATALADTANSLAADSAPGAHPVIFELSNASAFTLIMLGMLLVVWAPVLEEMLFRGALYHSLRRRLGVIVSALLVGFIFAVIHPQGFIAVPALTALAFNFAMVREWRGSLIAPMVMHAIQNGTVFTVLIFGLR